MTTPAVMIVCDYSLGYLGGAQIALVRQAEALASQGWRVVVVAPGAAELFRDRPVEGLTACSPRTRFTVPGIDMPVLEPRRVLTRNLTRLLKQHPVNAVIVHSEFALAVTAMRIARAHRIPTFHTVHTFFWRAPAALAPIAPLVTLAHRMNTGVKTQHLARGDSAINGALRSMTLRVAHEADLVLSPSEHQARALTEAGLQRQRVRVFSNVLQEVTGQPPEPVRESLRLVWAGRFAPEKRLEVALRAVALANERIGETAVHLDVAGGAGDDLPGVTFHGRLSSQEVGRLIARADAALLTSVGFDNQPMIALEAFAHSTPIVLSDAVLGHEFGGAAITANGADEQALADTLVELVQHREKLTAAGENARLYAQERGAEAHASNLRHMINEMQTSPYN